MEQKYQIGNEYGSVIWDIERLLTDIEKFRIRAFDVKHLAINNPFNGNEEYAMTTDITQPLIIVNLTENIDKLIDGNHRLQKAIKLGVEKIDAYFLTFEEHRDYIVDFNEEIYHQVANRWVK
ncbi:MAG: ParB N-terminal domain-containing protein [Oscillospiraceae bacterium]|nr:ParB N-terminal domain-containing protein [Oscillospiraceae bacterium]